jgi:hypothetical protein
VDAEQNDADEHLLPHAYSAILIAERCPVSLARRPLSDRG